MFGLYAKTQADGLELVSPGAVLTSRHGGCQVVGYDDRDVGILVHSIQETRHAAVGEGRVADDGNCRPLTCIGCTLCHRDACTHVNARMDCPVRGQEAQCVATDIAKDAWILVLLQHLVQRCIYVAMSATLAQLRRTGDYQRTHSLLISCSEGSSYSNIAERSGNAIGC